MSDPNEQLDEITEELGLTDETLEPEPTEDSPAEEEVTEPEEPAAGAPDEEQPEPVAEDEETESQAEEEPEEPAEAAPEAQPAPAPPQRSDRVPAGLYAQAKRENRELRRQLALREATETVLGMEAEAAPGPAPQRPAAEQSPLEQFVAAEGDDAAVPVKVLRAEQDFQNRQREQNTQRQTEQASLRAMQTSIVAAEKIYTAEQTGEGLDFNTVVLAGNRNLTPQDKAIIRASGPDAGDETYRRCLKRAIESGTPQGEAINRALVARRLARTGQSSHPQQRVTNPKPKPKGEPPTREQVLQRPAAPSRTPELDRLGLSKLYR